MGQRCSTIHHQVPNDYIFDHQVPNVYNKPSRVTNKYVCDNQSMPLVSSQTQTQTQAPFSTSTGIYQQHSQSNLLSKARDVRSTNHNVQSHAVTSAEGDQWQVTSCDHNDPNCLGYYFKSNGRVLRRGDGDKQEKFRV